MTTPRRWLISMLLGAMAVVLAGCQDLKPAYTPEALPTPAASIVPTNAHLVAATPFSQYPSASQPPTVASQATSTARISSATQAPISSTSTPSPLMTALPTFSGSPTGTTHATTMDDQPSPTPFLAPTVTPSSTWEWVSPSEGHQGGARISGDTVVWVEEDAGAAPGTAERVWYKSLTSGQQFPVSDSPGRQTCPDISGDLIVWADTRNSSPYDERDIYGYRISSGQEFPIATGPNDQNTPAISGSKVVWVELNNETLSIKGIDLAGAPFVVTSVPTDLNCYYSEPAIDGNIVAYGEVCGSWKIPDTFSHTIYAYDLSTRVRTKVGDGGSEGGQVAVSGSRIAWASGSIHVFDLSTGQDLIVAGGCYYFDVDIDGDLVVWSEGRRIVGYDLASGSTLLIFDGSSDQDFPHVSNRTVVWSNCASGDTHPNIAFRRLPDQVASLAPRY